VLRRNELRRVARGRLDRSSRPPVGRAECAVDELFSTIEVPHGVVPLDDSPTSVLDRMGRDAAKPSDRRPAGNERPTGGSIAARSGVIARQNSTKEGSAKRWLSTYVAKEFTLFAVRPTREASGVTNLLGESLLGIVHCDRARIYLSLKRLQWCWAHLKRDF
jgi:hypothetical protein